MKFRGRESVNLRTTAELFADNFQSVYSPRSDVASFVGPLPEPMLSSVSVTRTDIETELKKLDPYKSIGPDAIPNSLL